MNGLLWIGVAATLVLVAAVLIDGLSDGVDSFDLGPDWLSLPVAGAFVPPSVSQPERPYSGSGRGGPSCVCGRDRMRMAGGAPDGRGDARAHRADRRGRRPVRLYLAADMFGLDLGAPMRSFIDRSGSPPNPDAEGNGPAAGVTPPASAG